MLECSIPFLMVDRDSRVREPARDNAVTGGGGGGGRTSRGGEARASYISEKQPGVPAASSLTQGLRLHNSPSGRPRRPEPLGGLASPTGRRPLRTCNRSGDSGVEPRGGGERRKAWVA